MQPQFELDENPSADDLARLGQGLTQHASQHLSAPGFQKFALFRRDKNGQIQAGISGMINWNWAFVQNFWLAPGLRGKHLGTRMLAEFEAYAKKRGCQQIHLDTFSFQAPEFYEKQGYTLFATLDDYPVGHKRHFYRKQLCIADTKNEIDTYIAGFPAQVQVVLQQIRATIKKAAPNAQERISYKIPAFYLDGVLVYYAAFKKHIGLYPPVRGNKTLEKAVAKYAGPKGNLQFPLNQPIPYKLIERIVRDKLKTQTKLQKQTSRLRRKKV